MSWRGKPPEVWIIGTEPPDPRCDLVFHQVARLVDQLHLRAKVRHLPCDAREAVALAADLGLVPGTAELVARRAALDLDWPHLARLEEHPVDPPEHARLCGGAAARWTPELDAVLRPCEQAARRVGVLMTPVVVVDGEVVHEGSVPSEVQLRTWLSPLKKRTP